MPRHSNSGDTIGSSRTETSLERSGLSFINYQPTKASEFLRLDRECRDNGLPRHLRQRVVVNYKPASFLLYQSTSPASWNCSSLDSPPSCPRDFPPAPSHSAAANEAKPELTVVKIFATVSVLHFRVDQTSPLTTC